MEEKRCNNLGCDKKDVKRCSRCKQVFYCSVEHQQEDWKYHRGVCDMVAIKAEPYSVNQLIEAVMNDVLPSANSVLVDYGFHNCKNTEEESKLLSLYTGLIKLLECDVFKLHEACRAGKLKEFITKVYRKKGQHAGYYFQWFSQRPEIVKNPYPLADI